jgi:hypothetical protein
MANFEGKTRQLFYLLQTENDSKKFNFFACARPRQNSYKFSQFFKNIKKILSTSIAVLKFTPKS